MAVNILLKRSATASKRPVGASMAFGELNLNYDAATGGLFYKDSAGSVVKVGPCQVSATAPNSTPAGSSGNSAGEFWYDSSTSTLKVYNGTAWVEAGGAVDSVTGTAPITVNNTDPLNPVVGISAASTAAPGAVQLNDTTSSSSTTQALTANQGRILQTQIDALVISSNLTFAGTIDAATGNMVTVSTEGAAKGFTIGSPLPSPAAGNAEYFVIVTVAGTMTPPGGSAQVCHQGDWFLSTGSAWQFLDIGYNAPYATTTTPGVVQLATNAEVQAGVETTHAVTSSGLQSKVSDSVSTTSSTTLASSTAVKAAYDAGIQGQTDAAAAQATADGALPLTGGTLTGDVYFQAPAYVQSTTLTLDSASELHVDGNTLLNGVNNIYGTAVYHVGSDTHFWSTVNFQSSAVTIFEPGSSTTIDGSFLFNVSPTYAAGVDIGPAIKVTYDNATSGLTATEVQSAIDEVDGLANAAQADATQALSDAAAAQATADDAMPKAGGTFTGAVNFNADANFNSPFVNFGPGSVVSFDPTSVVFMVGSVDFNGAVAFYSSPAWDTVVDIGPSAQVTYDNATSGLTATYVQGAIDEVDGLANAAQADATQALSDAAAAQATADQAVLDAAAAQSDATQALSDAAAAQATADAAMPKAGGTFTGPVTFDVAPVFPAGVDIGPAAQVTYDNAVSGLAATNVQGAIDEVAATANAALPKAGGTMTGDIVMSSGVTVNYADTTATSVAAANQLPVVVDSATGDLVIATVFDCGSY